MLQNPILDTLELATRPSVNDPERDGVNEVDYDGGAIGNWVLCGKVPMQQLLHVP